MLTKNQLMALWKEHDFKPTKRLGQNFLIDKNIKDKILKNLELKSSDTVIEIGAGFGELTLDLARLTKEVFATEKDRKIAKILNDSLELPRNVVLLEKDFLDVNLEEIAKYKKIIIYGNIPYYVTSPILEKLFNNIAHIKSIYLVVQKEIADRILATPHSRNIGRLSLYVQYYTEPKRIFKIGKGCFHPSPQVESVFLKLDVLKKRKIQVGNEDLFFRVIKKAYSQRRKTVLNSLSGMGIEKSALSNLLNKAGINPLARAEDLSLQDFAHLANAIELTNNY